MRALAAFVFRQAAPRRLIPSIRQVCAALLLTLLVAPQAAQAAGPEKPWTAKWIAAPDVPGDAAGVFHFRKTIDLKALPAHFVVRISADNRYRLLVNGMQVSRGPARGDIMHWRYETVDIAPQLHAGMNVIAATVWNWGEFRPGAQVSRRTAFLLQTEDAANRRLDTGPSWKVAIDEGYGFTRVTGPDSGGYYVAGPGETLDAAKSPQGWDQARFDDSRWKPAVAVIERALPRGSGEYGDGVDWQLVPRNIPPMEERPIRFAEVRRSNGIAVPDGFVAGKAPLTVPAHGKVSLLLDQRELTMGYPVIVTSGGRGATASLTFAESMFDAQGRKGNRNDIANKTIRGVRNRISFDGGTHRRIEGLWLRTWRYVQVDVETADEPLTIEDVSGIFTAYPFEQRAAFSSDQPWTRQVWDIDWRVFRLSAFETFWDTPYYEQFQYVGDTRIESLISLYNSGDDRLMRNAIEQFDTSRIAEGLTASRHPSQLPQYIPPFSLWWVAMIHDHWMNRGDAQFARRFLPGERDVIGWYERHLDAGGLLGPMPWWNFLDWTPAFDRGVAPGAEDGNSTALSLQFAYVLKLAADLEEKLGNPAEAVRYRLLAERINAAARARSWDARRGLFADTPEKSSFSQQTNALAILSGAIPQGERKALMDHVLADKSLTQASYYFRFYLHEALAEAGLGDRYLDQLGPWQEMLRLGLTTTAETPEPSRSDSHAWSAHPNYHFLALVLGIQPVEPGFRTVIIAPALGHMKRASGHMPTPAGDLAVQFTRDGTGVVGIIDLPANVSGTFVWNGQASPLKPGRNQIRR
ncbi:MAG: alpha-L-rhamnosidase C-terminal domain-containing protein [Sphingomicrobium sp.]